MKEIVIDAVIENLTSVLNFLDTEMEEKNINAEIQNNVKIAADEIFINIASYAYAPSTGSVCIRVEIINKEIIIEFEDSGVKYNPLEKEDPDITSPAIEREIGGLGIFMAKKIMDTVEYQYKNNKNILKMKKRVQE